MSLGYSFMPKSYYNVKFLGQWTELYVIETSLNPTTNYIENMHAWNKLKHIVLKYKYKRCDKTQCNEIYYKFP